MTNNKLIKNQAKEALSLGNNWVVAVAGTLIIGVIATFIYYVLSLTEVVPVLFDDYKNSQISESVCYLVGLLTVMLSTPFLLGYIRLCYKIAKGGKVQLSEMFYYYTSGQNYRRALSICILYISKFVLMFSLISIIPTGIVWWLYRTLQTINAGDCLILLTIITIMSAVISVLIMAKYVNTVFIFFENECLYEYANMYSKASKKIYKSQKHSVIGLALSFFAWIFMLPFVLPLLYIMPYFTVSICNFCKWSIYSELINNE